MKYARVFSLIIFLWGCTSYLMVKSGWANYLWDRFNYGSSIKIAEKCFNLPFGWVVFPGGGANNADVRRHFLPNEGDVYAHIHFGSLFEGVSDEWRAADLYSKDYALYDMGANSSFDPIRFIAINKSDQMGIFAAREDLLRELIEGLSIKEHCKIRLD